MKYIKNNMFQIDLSKVGRTKMQKFVVSQLIKDNKLSKLIDYIESFKTNERSRISLYKPQDTSFDALATKRPDSTIAKARAFYNPDTNHNPISKDIRYFGVEIECCIPWASVGVDAPCGSSERECYACEGSGELEFHNRDTGHSITGDCPSCDGSGVIEDDEDSDEYRSNEDAHDELKQLFRQNKIKFATVKTDSSIEVPDSDYFAVEITVLTRADDFSNLEKACKLLNDLEARVNKSCGLHVHLDARHLDRDQVSIVGEKFKKALPLLQSIVPESRRNNTYCKGQVSFNDRYSAVNLSAYNSHKSIEIRLHSSTTDFTKIKNWITLLNTIANANSMDKCEELNDITQHVYLSEDVLEYFAQRIALFSKMPKSCTNETAKDNDACEVA